MPSDSATTAKRSALTIEQLRILRLAVGTSISLWFSQFVAWDMSFVAPVITLVMLGLPLPAPKLKSGIGFVLLMTGCMYAGGVLLLPTLVNQPAVGILLIVIALYWSFYYTAKGGSPLLGTFATLGIALAAAIGSVDIDQVFILARSIGFAAAVGMLFVWLAYAILPDSSATNALPPGGAPKKPPPEPPDLQEARWSAGRSFLIVFPIALWFLLSSASTSYLPVMLKVASMGQQTTNAGTREAARSLTSSTVIGGVLAIIGWNVLSITPTLTMYTLIVALAGLIIGPRVFKGLGMQPDGGTWSYGYLTMIVILAPAVMDSASGAPAGAKFWDRLIMFASTGIYALAAVYVVDAFKPRRLRRLWDEEA